MTRRTIFAFAAGVMTARGQEYSKDNTHLVFINGDSKDSFGVGVRTDVEADQVLVTVFYRAKTRMDGKEIDLLLSKESIAPVDGLKGYGGTRENFHIPRESVKFVRLSFFKQLSQIEIDA